MYAQSYARLILAQALHEGGFEISAVGAVVRTALPFKYICIPISGNTSILRDSGV